MTPKRKRCLFIPSWGLGRPCKGFLLGRPCPGAGSLQGCRWRSIWLCLVLPALQRAGCLLRWVNHACSLPVSQISPLLRESGVQSHSNVCVWGILILQAKWAPSVSISTSCCWPLKALPVPGWHPLAPGLSLSLLSVPRLRP